MEPYLAKIRKRKKPVLIVDGFAGPGKFQDGEIGSPLIICAKVAAELKRDGPHVVVWCIERDEMLVDQLKANLSGFSFAQAIPGYFGAQVGRIAEVAASNSILLYLDPFSVSDVELASIRQIAAAIRQHNSSVELLLNFNTPHFVRWCLATMSRPVPRVDPNLEDTEILDASEIDPPGHDRLDAIVGGTWWKDVLASGGSFPQIVRNIAEQLETALRDFFGEACFVEIKPRQIHRVPKYHMVYGSRHSDGLELMNDAMVRAYGHSDFEMDLFAPDEVDDLILSLAADWIPRGDLILAIIRKVTCRYYRKEIRGRIEQLLKAGKLLPESGNPRINDNVRVRSRLSSELDDL